MSEKKVETRNDKKESTHGRQTERRDSEKVELGDMEAALTNIEQETQKLQQNASGTNEVPPIVVSSESADHNPGISGFVSPKGTASKTGSTPSPRANRMHPYSPNSQISPRQLGTPGRSMFRPAPKLAIATIIQMGYCTNEARKLRVKVVYVDERRPQHEGVTKDRRKILLADECNSVIAFIIRKEPVAITLNSTIVLSHFRVANGTVTIHDKSIVTANSAITVPDHVIDMGREKYDRPQVEITDIQVAKSLQDKARTSVCGRVVQVDKKKLVGGSDPAKQKYVQEIILTQNDATIKISLWEAAAVFNRLTVGSEVQISDATAMYNKYHKATVLSVNYMDQIRELPPKESEEDIEISGIDLSRTGNIIRVSTERGDVNSMANINIAILHSALGLTGNAVPSQLIDYLPAIGSALFVGDTITQLTIYHHSQMETDFDSFMQEGMN